ncbi:MAG TPA: 16S rRNA (cytosine(1402)-N(4))-methyltransferase RsmH [Candidatus Paceibacterota bacterium]
MHDHAHSPSPSVHVSVLLQEVVSNLLPQQVSQPLWYLDGTLGGAGHALAIVNALKGKVNVIGLDRDIHAIQRARQTLAGGTEKLILEVANFRNLDQVLTKHGIATENSLDMILLDLGLSSDELDASGKGFTFQKEEPLLMTMGDPAAYAFTAADIVNTWKETDIANVIYAYGEETAARRIARAIVNYRDKKKFETTTELADLVRGAVPAMFRKRKIHPATKTFQALRIAVNDELKAIEQGLDKGYTALKPGGRMGVISFHSLEDRIVKNFVRDHGSKEKAIKPTHEEIAQNPRSRSAKLRIITKA